MPASSKPTFPAIFSPGLTQIQVEDIGRVFIDPAFNTPLRQRLTSQLRLFIGELRRLNVQGDLWINGSYSTKKPEPADVDLALCTSRIALSAMSAEELEGLRSLSDEENRAYVRTKWQVDFYVFEASDVGRRSYFLDLFSRNPDASNQKGIPFVRL